MREWRQWGRWRGLLSAAAIGLLLGVMGPFGSQTTLAPAVRYAFWMGTTLVGFGAVLAADRVIPAGTPANRIGRIVAVAAVSAVPMTFFAAWAIGEVRPGRTFSVLQLLTLFPYVALIQLLIAWVTAPAQPVAGAPAGEQSAPQYPREFLAKLPTDLRRDIVALEAEDHYLRVHTLNGSALILMRLADAAALIDPRLGLRVHRSWWVARDAVRRLEMSSGRATARLVDDKAVPISRSYLPAARAALSDPL